MQRDCRIIPKSRMQSIQYLLDGKKYKYWQAIAYLVDMQKLSNREAVLYLKSLRDWKGDATL